MTKRISLFCSVLILGAIIIGCARQPPPYDARAIDPAEVDSPSRQESNTPAAGGGKVLNERQW